MKSRRRPGVATASQAFLTFLVGLAAIFGIGIFLGRTRLPVEIAILMIPAVTLAVAVGAIRVFRLRPFRAFLLRPAPLSDLLLSVPVALSLFVVSDQLANLVQQFAPLDEAFIEALNRMVRADGFIEWMIRLAGIGFGAAISEELLFRGVILTGFQRFGRFSAIFVSALLFTFMHGLPLPNYLLAGVILGLAATATGSILVPISIHFFHNTAALLLSNLADLKTLGDPVWTPPGILIPAVLILAIGTLHWLRRMARTRKPDPDAAAPQPPETRMPEMPPPPPHALAIGKDLMRAPVGRRRLGLVALTATISAGALLSLGLFLVLGYLVDPGQQHAAAIQHLRQMSHEAQGADPWSDEIDAAFDTLGELNREGRLGFRHIWRATRAVAQATRDGEFGEGDVEDLLTVVGRIRRESPAAGGP